MTCTQAITQEHILQNWAALKEHQAQEVNDFNQKTLVDPTVKYFDETQRQHLKGLQPTITALSLDLHSDPPLDRQVVFSPSSRWPLKLPASHSQLVSQPSKRCRVAAS